MKKLLIAIRQYYAFKYLYEHGFIRKKYKFMEVYQGVKVIEARGGIENETR
jgi:hypothetical protein